MHGGMKIHRGSAAAARNYVEADRSRADEYYLAEGTGVAMRFVATSDGIERQADMDGETYARWVAGYDIETGVPKGRLRTDDKGVRFVEVTVNGPKTWSLAAAVHPEIADAYDAAQMAAANEIIGWLAAHATTRVGPRGRQMQVPVEQIEAAVGRTAGRSWALASSATLRPRPCCRTSETAQLDPRTATICPMSGTKPQLLRVRHASVNASAAFHIRDHWPYGLSGPSASSAASPSSTRAQAVGEVRTRPTRSSSVSSIFFSMMRVPIAPLSAARRSS